jgi:hypothetical protein
MTDATVSDAVKQPGGVDRRAVKWTVGAAAASALAGL